MVDSRPSDLSSIVEKPRFSISGPGWPDMRGWVAIGFFAVTFYVLWMIKQNPALLANASFMQLAGALMTGGPLLVATNLFGGTKSGSETSEKLAEAVKRTAEQGPK